MREGGPIYVRYCSNYSRSRGPAHVYRMPRATPPTAAPVGFRTAGLVPPWTHHPPGATQQFWVRSDNFLKWGEWITTFFFNGTGLNFKIGPSLLRGATAATSSRNTSRQRLLHLHRKFEHFSLNTDGVVNFFGFFLNFAHITKSRLLCSGLPSEPTFEIM